MSTIYHGTDVSRYQGTINWASYAAAKDFVIIKAGGADVGLYTDSFFNANRTGARAQAGLRIGYYFFGDSGVDPATAANYFISILGSLNSGEILVLDIENHIGGGTPNDDWAFVFVTAIYQNYGFYPFCYMSQFSPTNSIIAWPTTAPNSPLWMANYSLADTNFSSTAGNADGVWDHGHVAPSYQLLQYSDSGSVSGIPATVDLDSFFSPNNTLNDWNAFGFNAGPPAPVNGSLTVATVANPTMTYEQPATEAIVVPSDRYDQILFSAKFNTSVTSASWPVTVNGPATGLKQYAYPIGNYSFNINGASNFNDYGFINAGDFGQYPGTLPKVTIQPIVDNKGQLTFNVAVNQASGTITVDLSLNIALLAYPHTTDVDVSSVTQGIARANAIARVEPSAYSTYRRVFSDTNVGATGATTVGHALGTVPNILYWVQDNTGTIEIQPVSWASGGHTTAFGLSMDSSNLYFYVDALNSDCWYRTYEDN